MTVNHVKGPLRNSPSGPLADLLNNTSFYFASNVEFGEFVSPIPGQNTVESSRVIYTLDNRFALPNKWDVIVNPDHYNDEDPPSWLVDWSLSHVHIVNSDVDINALDPLVPVGVLGVEVVIGMSYLKELAIESAILPTALFDLMFFKQGSPVLVAPEAPPPPPIP